MNTLDMYTREQANKIHLDGLHREAKRSHWLRDVKQNRNSENTITKRRLQLALTFAALSLLVGLFLVTFVMRF